MFGRSNNTDVIIDVRMDWSILEKKSSFKMPGLIFSSNLDRGCYIISIPRTTSKKIVALIHSMKFLFPETALYLCKSSIHAILLSRLGWCPWLLLGIVRSATETDL